jgi:tRNA/rRNA methyltransferase
VVSFVPPVVILVEPQLGENIGMVARAMLNCAWSNLRLVAPRDGWPNPAAVAASAGATAILETASVFPTLASALEDVSVAFATTAQYRAQVKPVYDLPEAMAYLAANAPMERATAVVFGPERTGLCREDIARCDACLTISLNPAFSSLNLAQAVLLVAYTWRIQTNGTIPLYLERAGALPATKKELFYFLERLQGCLEQKNFLKPIEKKPAMMRNLQNIFARTQLTEQELRTLHGVLTALTRLEDNC